MTAVEQDQVATVAEAVRDGLVSTTDVAVLLPDVAAVVRLVRWRGLLAEASAVA